MPQQPAAARVDDPRIQRLKHPFWIGHDAGRRILETLEDLLTYPEAHRMRNLAIVGNSRNGKTLLLETFVRRHCPMPMPEAPPPKTLPVVMVQCPPVADEARLYLRILKKIHGSKGSPREPVQEKFDRVVTLLRELETKILILDEFGFFQAGTALRQITVLNVLKALGNELRISIVVAGVPAVVNLLRSDEQIDNRFEQMDLPRWKCDKEFRRLLMSFERELGLREESGLSGPDIARRVHEESAGVIGHVHDLLCRMAMDAIRSGKERIELDDFNVQNLRRLGWTAPAARHTFTE